MKSNVPEVTCGGALVSFAHFTAAYEDVDNGRTGVMLKSSGLSPYRGALMFYPDPHADVIRKALGDQIAKKPPKNTKELPLV